MSKVKLAILCGLLVVALFLPFIIGQISAGNNQIFGGFLINPIDGNSYLAKMRLGWEGEWRFKLPYTAEPVDGAFLFLFYILLGHISRITSLPLILVFHLFRLLGAAFLFYALYRLLKHTFKGDPSIAFSWVLILAMFGSGLGWVAALLGGFTSDFWVAEAYPFLSMYANPHFPIGLGLTLLYFDWLVYGIGKKRAPWLILLGLLTAAIQPFAVIISAVVSILYVSWSWFEIRRVEFLPVLWYLIGSGPYLLYQYQAIRADPVLSVWNTQNLTPSPPFWDFFVSFSPALILAAIGVYVLIRRKELGRYKLFVIWLAAGLALAYFPFSLQRRFLLGYFVPSVVLGGVGLFLLVGNKNRLWRNLGGIVILASIVTNIFVIAGGIAAASNHDPLLDITKDEYQAFAWMNTQGSGKPLVLASAQTGLFIPAYTSWRVLYGHPFETVYAEERKSEVNQIFTASSAEEIGQYIASQAVSFVFWGPREQSQRKDNPFAEYLIAYQNATVTIYSIGDR